MTPQNWNIVAQETPNALRTVDMLHEDGTIYWNRPADAVHSVGILAWRYADDGSDYSDLDRARATEALRRNPYAAQKVLALQTALMEAARLARTGWEPPTPIDPHIAQAREIVAKYWDARSLERNAARYRAGEHDNAALMVVALAALKAPRQ